MWILKVLSAAAAEGKRVESQAGLSCVLPDTAQPEATDEEKAVQARSIVDGDLCAPKPTAA
jgi:hypothetical protein